MVLVHFSCWNILLRCRVLIAKNKKITKYTLYGRLKSVHFSYTKWHRRTILITAALRVLNETTTEIRFELVDLVLNKLFFFCSSLLQIKCRVTNGITSKNRYVLLDRSYDRWWYIYLTVWISDFVVLFFLCIIFNECCEGITIFNVMN